MSILVDTNILTQIAEPEHPQNAAAASAIKVLLANGRSLHLVPQNVYEFWVVATRPIADNGLGMYTPLAKSTLDDLMKVMSILPDTADVFPEWQRLVVAFDCKGKVAHDARSVAAMNVHGVSEILTFNSRDFTRYTNITVLNPEIESSRQRGPA